MEAGSHLYKVGTETPRLLATSHVGIPLDSGFSAALILLSVISRFLPPLQPSWRATSRHAHVRSTRSSLSILARLANTWKKPAKWRASVKRVSQALELHALLLKLAYKINQMLKTATEPIQFLNDKGVSLTKVVLSLSQSRSTDCRSPSPRKSSCNRDSGSSSLP